MCIRVVSNQKWSSADLFWKMKKNSPYKLVCILLYSLIVFESFKISKYIKLVSIHVIAELKYLKKLKTVKNTLVFKYFREF